MLFSVINFGNQSDFRAKVNFEELARCTDDFNGAMLKAVCVEAVSKIVAKLFLYIEITILLRSSDLYYICIQPRSYFRPLPLILLRYRIFSNRSRGPYLILFSKRCGFR